MVYIGSNYADQYVFSLFPYISIVRKYYKKGLPEQIIEFNNRAERVHV